MTYLSLYNAPTIEALLTSLIQVLSHQQQGDLPESVSDRISQLLTYLQKHRCLLILDNAETILTSNEGRTGQYRSGYEGYGELFKRIGEFRHQSCLVLTSREKPNDTRINYDLFHYLFSLNRAVLGCRYSKSSLPTRPFQIPGSAIASKVSEAKGDCLL